MRKLVLKRHNGSTCLVSENDLPKVGDESGELFVNVTVLSEIFSVVWQFACNFMILRAGNTLEAVT